jgi:hypothetical protein
MTKITLHKEKKKGLKTEIKKKKKKKKGGFGHTWPNGGGSATPFVQRIREVKGKLLQ